MPDEDGELTQQEVEENPELRPDPSAAKEGILDDEDPAGFEPLEVDAAEDLLAEEGLGANPRGRHRSAGTFGLPRPGLRERHVLLRAPPLGVAVS
jgi:hypothetical protein